ncbi:RNA pseudouridine synthase [Patescibacteria group bacterium]|nr:RNA pseudouridine synthase [Patescibacteria group bacterium]
MKIDIIKEHKDYLVINKPAGLVVHATGNRAGGKNLADLLVEDYPELVGVGDDPLRPGIVHRLDKNVSGLLVIARSQEMFNCLKKQFQSRKINKVYAALVYGATSKDYDTINFPIKRSTKGFKMAAKPLGTPINDDVRDAKTFFDVTKRLINYTFMSVKITTGRTHQIRCHLTAYGYPIVGDDLYSTKTTRIKNKKINLGRVFLCATTLGFRDLEGEWQELKIDLPKDLKEFLKYAK